MSTQSAQTRNASQATVNQYAQRVEPVTFTDEPKADDKRVSWAWVAPLAIGVYVELAYVVPAVSDWLSRIFAP